MSQHPHASLQRKGILESIHTSFKHNFCSNIVRNSNRSLMVHICRDSHNRPRLPAFSLLTYLLRWLILRYLNILFPSKKKHFLLCFITHFNFQVLDSALFNISAQIIPAFLPSSNTGLGDFLACYN